MMHQSSVAQNIRQLKDRIKTEFISEYSEHATTLSENLIDYFNYHQFDEWKDIQDDICNSYDECCCKQILISVLNLQDNASKNKAYIQLQSCFYPKKIVSPPPSNLFKRFYNQIQQTFTRKLKNPNIASRICQAIKTIVQEQEFKLSDIKEDLTAVEDSYIINDMSEIDPLLMKQYGNPIQKILINDIAPNIEIPHTSRHEDENKKPFNIYNMKLNPSQKSQIEARNLVHETAECKDIFLSVNSKNEMQSDEALIYAKAIDLVNGYPILMWLSDMYHLDRLNEYRNSFNVFDYNYDAAKWFTQNQYCKWMKQYQNNGSNIDSLKTAIVALNSRAMPKFNLNHIASTRIADSLLTFAEYTLAFTQFIYTQYIHTQDEQCPVQIDFWIIPQGCYKNESTSLPVIDDISDIENEEYSDDNKNDSEICLDMEKSIGNIHEFLYEAQYTENEDFWTLHDDDIVNQYNKCNINNYDNERDKRLKQKFTQLWSKMRKVNKNKSGERFVLIVDRREYKYFGAQWKYHNIDIHKSLNELNDKLYLIKPKQFNTISKKYNTIPESLLGASKQYLLPSVQMDGMNGYGALDPMNGYKFVLSYHIFQLNYCKIYWYFGGGAIRFKLDQMIWLWSKYFIKNKNNQYQQLEISMKNSIHNYIEYIKDDGFEQFYQQAKSQPQDISTL